MGPQHREEHDDDPGRRRPRRAPRARFQRGREEGEEDREGRREGEDPVWRTRERAVLQRAAEEREAADHEAEPDEPTDRARAGVLHRAVIGAGRIRLEPSKSNSTSSIPDPSSEAVQLTSRVPVTVLPLAGELIVTFGGVTSTVTSAVFAATFPARSNARTTTEWAPSGTPGNAYPNAPSTFTGLVPSSESS